MDTQLLILAGVGVALLIGCLVMREGTEVKLARMLTALMSLRNQERGLEQQIEAVQNTKSQINEVMSRAPGRQSSIGHLLEFGLRRSRETVSAFAGGATPRTTRY